jgi:hypothetical protein
LGERYSSPQGVESLLLLSRHAVGLPGADAKQLQRALTRGERMSKLDGASPTLRFGVYMLRWRLCADQHRSDCGPMLPDWALQDRFEARLVREMAVMPPAENSADRYSGRRFACTFNRRAGNGRILYGAMDTLVSHHPI